MGFFNDEKNIIDMFQSVNTSEVYFSMENGDIINVFESIYSTENWKNWIYCAGKSDPPPDFYLNHFKYMMEVMRVDDHTIKNEKGKLINQTNIAESQLEGEIKKSGILDLFPYARLLVNTKTELSTIEDHNYIFYKKNFARVLQKHDNSADLYRGNHPGFSLIYLIMDESSGYICTTETIEKDRIVGDVIKGFPHLHFQDNAFLDILSKSKADYIIWDTPLKLINVVGEILDLPKECVFDVHKVIPGRNYNQEKIISSEI